MMGDLNCAHPGSRWEYAQLLNRDLGMADNKFEIFLSSTQTYVYTDTQDTRDTQTPETHRPDTRDT